MNAQSDAPVYNESFSNHASSEIIGVSEAIMKIKKKILELGENDCTVLIEGESGTGKELVARALHNCSSRRSKSFIVVDCGTIQNSLIDTELFGHVKGAFTDAKESRLGIFASAAEGTVFIDEIGDLLPDMQIKLLRGIETRTFKPLGSDTERKTDVRIISATNRSLESLIEQKSFRLDLYHRLNGIKITIPPLRERKSDIRLLVNHFIDFYNKQFNKNITAISNEVEYVLYNYNYPGNVRELRGIIECALVSCKSEIIEGQDLPAGLISQFENLTPYRGVSLKDYESWIIENTLKKNKGNKAKTAEELGIDRTTLARKIREYGIKL